MIGPNSARMFSIPGDIGPHGMPPPGIAFLAPAPVEKLLVFLVSGLAELSQQSVAELPVPNIEFAYYEGP